MQQLTDGGHFAQVTNRHSGSRWLIMTIARDV